MPIFTVEAVDAKGKRIKAEIDASNANDAITKLKAKGYKPTNVKEKGGQPAPDTKVTHAPPKEDGGGPPGPAGGGPPIAAVPMSKKGGGCCAAPNACTSSAWTTSPRRRSGS